MKKILLIITLFLIGINNVNAEPCDAYDIKRLKEIAEGVEITYEKLEPYKNEEGTMLYDNFNIMIRGLTDELLIYDESNKIRYSKSNEVNGMIIYKSDKVGKVKFLIYSTYCPNIIKSLSINLPIYNPYHDLKECEEIDYNIDVCDEYLEEKVTYEHFYASYIQYKESLITQNNNKKSIIKYMIISGIIIVFVILALLIKRRKERLV